MSNRVRETEDDTARRTFPDGALYRFEIPSVEGPRCVEAVIRAAERWDVPVTRMSQGTGTFLLTAGEIREMVSLCAAAGVELCLFVRPCAGWDVSAASRTISGPAYAGAVWGDTQFAFARAEILRAAELGVRSVLIGDVGVLKTFGELVATGELPLEMQAKTSVVLPATNPGTAAVYEALGASTINVAPDLSVSDMASLRASVDVPLDVYIEAPDDVGGFVRYHDLVEVVNAASPVYVKLGLRNAPLIYPSGGHLEATAIALAEERVRRARIAFELLARAGLETRVSTRGAAGLAVPVVT